MSEKEYIEQLEKRIEKLEQFISHIRIDEGKDIIFENCPIGDMTVGGGCNLSFERCSVGGVISDDIDDAEDRIDELEDRLQNIISKVEDMEDTEE